MKSKILGLLAVVLLAGPMAANATVLYEFDSDFGDFKFTAATFLTATTSIPAADLFDVVNEPAGETLGSVSFVTPEEPSPVIILRFPGGGLVLIAYTGWPGPFDAFTTYTHLSGSTLTISSVASVPEPATLALLGLALAGIGFSRRRKLH